MLSIWVGGVFGTSRLETDLQVLRRGWGWRCLEPSGKTVMKAGDVSELDWGWRRGTEGWVHPEVSLIENLDCKGTVQLLWRLREGNVQKGRSPGASA